MTDAFNSFTSVTAPAIDKIIKQYYSRKIKNASQHFMKEIYEDIASYCTRKGKRLRPVLALLAYEGYKKGKKNSAEMAKLAAALEMMHSFLLIQDDIVDKSTMRRGEKAMHVITGERYASITNNDTIGADTAVIAADVLFSNALELVASAEICNRARRRFLAIFADTYEMTAWGQILDILNSKTKTLSVSQNVPLNVSLMKTAYYTIYYPLLMGHVLAGPERSGEREAISSFALPLGLAFQIRDDVLGVFGNEEETGKSTDSDILEGKFTLLIENTIEKLPKKERDDFIARFLSLKKKKSDVEIIRSAIVSSGALDTIRQKQTAFVDESLSHLDSLALSQTARNQLIGLASAIRLS